MSDGLGQQMVVENVGGAAGMTGTVRVARTAPDGYQLLFGTVDTIAIAPAVPIGNSNSNIFVVKSAQDLYWDHPAALCLDATRNRRVLLQ